MYEIIKDKLRAAPWLVATLGLLGVIVVLYPEQIGLFVWALCKVTAAAYVGYWVDRTMFRYSRPHQLRDSDAKRAAWFRRAIIVAACIVGVSLSV